MSAQSATARLHNVLAQFEGSKKGLQESDASAPRLHDAWQSVLPCQHDVVAVVAGSMTLDIVACTHGGEQPQAGTTLPGQVSQQPGGVARNIADALSRLIPAHSVKLVSVVGKDAAGSALSRLWDNHNERSTSGILVHSSGRTATVSTIMAGNEIYAGIADTGALLCQCTVKSNALEIQSEFAGIVEESLLASWILQHVTDSPACKLLLLDTNIPAQELQVVARTCWHKQIIVVVDPVSVYKSIRCIPLLQHIDIVKPGAAELQEICRCICHSKSIPLMDSERSRRFSSLLSSSHTITPTVRHLLSGLVAQCWLLLRQGLGTVLLSLGAQGCAVCQLMHGKEARERVPLGLVDHSDSRASIVMVFCAPMHVQAVSTTGAGDCLVAGTLAGLVYGLALGDAACMGVAAAAKSCVTFENVPGDLSWGSLAEDWEALREQSCAMLWAVDPCVLRKDR